MDTPQAITQNDTYRDILRKYWGYDDFRGIQSDIIHSIGQGRDTLGLMPTGGGKSITFQVPAMAQEGTCIVVTPLIALMKDQVENLRRRGIKAAAIHSGLSGRDILTILENTVFGQNKLLYVSPERLGTQLFRTKLSHMKVSFITVDEAHCISQWGYDFRPSYLRIAEIRKVVPDVPILALTATATPEVVDDIQDKLAFKERNVFKMSFARANLAYVVRKTSNKDLELLHILRNVAGSAIVYVRNRELTRDTALFLQENGITATFYHAGLENSQKDKRQNDWQNDRIRVMVATNAFGMGIDKPDVRLVVHIDCPDSIEAYFQEAGRAGRDGRKAYAVLLHEKGDLKVLALRVNSSFPPKDTIKTIYDQIGYFYQIAVGAGYQARFNFNIEKFCHAYHHFPNIVDSALHLLSQAGYIEYAYNNDNMPKVKFTVGRDDLYRLRNESPEEDRVMETIMRIYDRLFVDFRTIDEGLVADNAGIGENEVHEALKSLARKRVINYIPPRDTPYILFTQRREDSEHVILPKDVYETRKEKYAERIKAIIHYVEAEDKCRSSMLLSYFGERKDEPCGLCDYCVGRRREDEEKRNGTEPETLKAQKAILSLLSDGQPHFIKEIRQQLEQFRTDTIKQATRLLSSEEKITLLENHYLQIKKG